MESNVTTLDHLLAERGKRYGSFLTHAQVTCAIKRIITKRLNERAIVLEDDQQEALDMIAHKIGRIVNGDPNYVDSWDDVAGYAQLVADRLRSLNA